MRDSERIGKLIGVARQYLNVAKNPNADEEERHSARDRLDNLLSNIEEDENKYSEEPQRAIEAESDDDDDEEDIPWLSVLEGTIEMLEYAQGKKPAFVTKYVDGKRVSAQWQMVDGTKVDPPDLDA